MVYVRGYQCLKGKLKGKLFVCNMETVDGKRLCAGPLVRQEGLFAGGFERDDTL